jgi:hypothetical protein
MTITVSTEFPGFGYKYEQGKNPFFQALVDENLRLLKTLLLGRLLLSSIAIAKPGYRDKYYPVGVNVVFQPTINQHIMPGTTMDTNYGSAGRITNQTEYNDAERARDGPGHGLPQNRGQLIPDLTAKAEAREDSQTAACNGTGSTCHVFYTNSEMLGKDGLWFIPHITMGHELIHCLHALTGTMDPDRKIEEWKTTGIKGYEDLPYTENGLRAEARYPRRNKYYASD